MKILKLSYDRWTDDLDVCRMKTSQQVKRDRYYIIINELCYHYSYAILLNIVVKFGELPEE